MIVTFACPNPLFFCRFLKAISYTAQDTNYLWNH